MACRINAPALGREPARAGVEYVQGWPGCRSYSPGAAGRRAPDETDIRSSVRTDQVIDRSVDRGGRWSRRGFRALPRQHECQGMRMMLRRSIRLFIAVVLACLLQAPVTRTASAQADPRQILTAVIQQLQTGTPNSNLVRSPALADHRHADQQQRRLHAAGSARAGDQCRPERADPAPCGTGLLHGARSISRAYSTWLLGISLYTNRIEYANFNIGAPRPSSCRPSPCRFPQTAAPHTGSVPNPPAESPAPRPAAPQRLVKRFPNLC